MQIQVKLKNKHLVTANHATCKPDLQLNSAQMLKNGRALKYPVTKQ